MFKRGFKSQCERRALEIRRSLDIPAVGPLSAMRLATHLAVDVWSAADVDGISESDSQQLFEVGRDEWSAFVLREGDHNLVVYNPRQSPPRVNSVVMHELAHIMLGHELARPTRTADGYFLNGNYDEGQEREADWLGGALLLPRQALLWMRAKDLTDAAAIEHFGVSLDMLRWRIRMTGVDLQVARSRF